MKIASTNTYVYMYLHPYIQKYQSILSAFWYTDQHLNGSETKHFENIASGAVCWKTWSDKKTMALQMNERKSYKKKKSEIRW